MIEKVVYNFIERNNLFHSNQKIIIGLSGGADSVALLLILKKLNYNILATHCNFHLRGKEANRDQHFVEQLCKQENIELHTTHFDTYSYAEEQKLSIEMAARELRYNWFDKLLHSCKADYLAVGHHKDDNIETLILNLARGAGLRGLSGIPPKNRTTVRPLLPISRKEIEHYLSERQQDYVTDSTNLEDEFARNKVRLNIIPQLEEINSGCRENIHRTINYLSDVESVFNQAIAQAIERVKVDNRINCALLQKEVAAQTLLYEMVYPLGFNSSQVEDVFEASKQNETRTFISSSHILLINRGYIIIERKQSKEEEIKNKPVLEYETLPIDQNFKLIRDSEIATFDASLIDPKELELRKWRAGDWFVPFGMKGRKNISDYFTDCKFTQEQKENQYLLCYKENIIWVVGHRTDNRYRLTKESKKALIIRFKIK